MIQYGRIKTSFPLIEKPAAFIQGGHIEQGFIMLHKEKIVELCPYIQQASQILSNSEPIGRVGNYRNVYYLELGLEIYTPDNGSNPGKGFIGVEELMQVLIFTTYYEQSSPGVEHAINRFVDNIIDIHPWEHPIINVSDGSSTWLYGGPT